MAGEAGEEAAAIPQRGARKPPNVLRRLGGYVDYGLTSFFGAIAGFVAVRPYTVLITCTIVGLVLGAGIVRINVVTAAEDLYTHQGTDGFKQRDYVESLYGYGTISGNIFTTALDNNGSNILTKPALLDLLNLWNGNLQVQGTYNNSNYTFEDARVCDRPGGPGSPCNVVSVLDYWNYSSAAIEADTDLFATVSKTTVDSLGRQLPPTRVMGGISYDSSGKISSVKAFQLVLYLQNNKDGSGSDKVDKVVEAWQKAQTPYVRAHDTTSNVQFYLLSDWARGDEADKTITGDVSLLVVGYVLLIVYGMIILSKLHPVESRAYMALANIGSIALAVLGSYGLCMVAGVDFSLVVQVLALLLLGLGTDDMLVTMAAHEETGREMPNATVVERVVATVSRARRGVVVASLTTFVAFCTGASSTLPALRDFMIYAAVGVVLVVIFQSTFYVACITLDVRRQQANKMDLLCCRTSKAGPSDGCCGRQYDARAPSLSQRVIGMWLPRIILNPFGKFAVLAITLFFLVMGAIGITRVKQNFDDDWFVPDKSWIKDVLNIRDQYFSQYSGKGALPFAVYTKNVATPPLDYFNYQSELLALSTKLQEDRYVSPVPAVQSWYVSYIRWLNTSAYSADLTAEGRPANSSLFYTSLKEYLAADGERFQNNVIFSNTSENVILSSSIDAFFITLSDSVQQVNAMNSVREVAKANGGDLQAFAYTFPFLFYEGYAVIIRDTVQEVIIAGSVVFVICLILLADLVAAIAVGLMVVFIDIELVGFIYWAGLYFNSVTSINLLLAIGIAVDYSAFYAFSFMTRVGTRNDRAHAALGNFGVAVFNGGFTMFLAILPAAAAQSYIFQTFFKMFSMIVALGLWHGLFTLPVVLSFIGSEPYESAYKRVEVEMNEKARNTDSADAPTDAPSQQAF